MNDQQMRRNVDESMRSGAAKMLDRKRSFDRDELIRIAQRAQDGDQHAYEMLVDGMSRFVFREAFSSYYAWRSHLTPQASFDDVFAAGLMGLHHALRKFDASRGYAFTTHAKAWVRNACQRCVYSMVGHAHVPRRTLTDGIPPDDPLVHALSLDHPDRLTGRAMHEDVPSPSTDAVFDVDLVRGILDVLTCVDPRLPRIVELLQQDYAYREIARIVGISPQRVRKLQRAGAEAVQASGLADDYLS